MKNWIVFIVSFVVSIIAATAIFILWKAEGAFTVQEEKAEQIALSSKALALVSDAYIYNGNEPYVTVFGLDEYGKEKAVFVSMADEEHAMEEVFLQDGITEQEAISVLRAENAVKKILHTKLGYEEAGAVWEITFVNDADKLNYVYILFEDGQWWKRILNL